MSKHRIARVALLALALLAPTACGPDAPAGDDGKEAAEPLTNRIDLPPEVAQNLGIEFAKVQRGKVAEVLEVHGAVRVPDDRQWSLASPADGRLRLRVRPWEQVTPGQVVGELVTPALVDAREDIVTASEHLVAARLSRNEAEGAGPLLDQLADALARGAESARLRVASAKVALGQAQGVEERTKQHAAVITGLERDGAATRDELTAARREHAEAASSTVAADRALQEAGVDAARLAEEAARATIRAAGQTDQVNVARLREDTAQSEVEERFAALAALTGKTVASLREKGDDGRQAWLTLTHVPVHAPAAGVVTSVDAADGLWLAAGSPICRIEDASRLYFEGRIPEGDLARIPPGARVRIHLLGGAGATLDGVLDRALPFGDPTTRTARIRATLPEGAPSVPAGTSATAEVVIGESEFDEILVPVSAVVQDGLDVIVFRRDPDDPNKVVRTPVTVGRRSGRLMEIIAGVSASDSVVTQGVHQLKQTGQGKAPENGHFHVDGTFHEGDEH